MQILITLFFVILSTTADPVTIVDVIKAFPTDDQNTWVIGEHEIKQNASTTFGSELPVQGNLAKVTFNEEDGIKRATEIKCLPLTASSISDGPYIIKQDEGNYTAISYQHGDVVRKPISLINGRYEISPNFPEVKTIKISPNPPSIPPSTFKQPEQLLAVSDLEGNLDQLTAFLKKHGIINDDYDWDWGSNHLLFNGDSVDRGDRVTELLWFIRKLQQQAREQDGDVHFVIGNHEAMILCDDLRYVHPKYEFVVKEFNIPYTTLFNMRSTLGHWMRAQNSIVQAGPYLFVHAGYSPKLLDLNESIESLNSSIRKTLRPPAWGDRDDLKTSLAWHRQGPLWFRGYFTKHLDTYGPKPTSDEIDAILKTHDAKAIIVGHTVVDHVGYLDDDERLICIDVKWSKPGKAEGLLIQGEQLSRLTMHSDLPLDLKSNNTSE
ncbi:MAG: metallophosphoesterase [Phycisphaerales bacterium]|nr:metallophosphoesterase [Phycisphaerales bacterium]